MEEIEWNHPIWDELPKPTRCINEPRCEVREWDMKDGSTIIFAPTEITNHHLGIFYLKKKGTTTPISLEEVKQRLK